MPDELQARAAAARQLVEDLRAEAAESALRSEKAREDLSRPEITRETVAPAQEERVALSTLRRAHEAESRPWKPFSRPGRSHLAAGACWQQQALPAACHEPPDLTGRFPAIPRVRIAAQGLGKLPVHERTAAANMGCQANQDRAALYPGYRGPIRRRAPKLPLKAGLGTGSKCAFRRAGALAGARRAPAWHEPLRRVGRATVSGAGRPAQLSRMTISERTVSPPSTSPLLSWARPAYGKARWFRCPRHRPLRVATRAQRVPDQCRRPGSGHACAGHGSGSAH